MTNKSGSEPSFEIFMPFYGNVEYFKSAVQSVLRQIDSNWKLTIIDDCYPDHEPEDWVRRLKDSRITYIRNSLNLGVSDNFNKCVELAKCDYVNILGCDDILRPNFVGQIRSLISDHPGIAVIQPGVEVINGNGIVHEPLPDKIKRIIRPEISGTKILGGELLVSSLLQGNWAYFPSLIWRKDLLQKYGFSKSVNVVQDLTLLLDIFFSGESMLIDSPVSFQYRRHRASVSSRSGPNGRKFLEEKDLFESAATRSLKLGWKAAAKSARFHYLSRANALTELPHALISRNKEGVRNILKHIFQ